MRFIIYITILFIFSGYSQQQSVLKDYNQVSDYNKIPQEKVFVHYNSTLLFAGENLYYKIYCLNDENNRLSTISKIAYVVLVNEKEEHIFQHKVKLINGSGSGDFFIPVSVPSGNYKLVAYTQWMLNASDHFFQGDLSILNPYMSNPDIVSKENDQETIQNETLENFKGSKTATKGLNIDIKIDKDDYNKRSMVTFEIEGLQIDENKGHYSVSVSRKNSFPKAPKKTTVEFSSDFKKGTIEKKNVTVGSTVYLPEMRGELVYGKIIPKESDPTKNYSEYNVGLSIPEKNDIYVVSTNENGEFLLNLSHRNNEDKDILIEVLGDQKDHFNAKIYPIPQIDYSKLDFYRFKISRSFKDDIIKRSIYNQIENNFYSIKPDTITEPLEKLPFYGAKDIYTYKLDEYTRFKTVKETLVEVVEGMWSTKDEYGKDVFGIRGYYPEQEEINYKPLLMIDGVIEQDQHKIINSEAKDIASIAYVRDRYYLGSKIFGGIVLLETLNKDYATTMDNTHITKVGLPELKKGEKRYFKQQYRASDSYSKIPDYRNQLLWIPNLDLDKDKKSVHFFTSDISGVYEISFEGFTKQGVPVSAKKEFEVN